MQATTNLNTYARIAGAAYIGIVICGILAEFILRGSLIELGNPTETARNIAESERIFRVSMLIDVLMLVFDATVGIALFAVFRSVSPVLNLASTAFRLLHTAVYGATILFLFFAVQLTTSPDYLSGLGAAQSEALGSLFIEAHAYGYAFALFFFAIHLALLGGLILRSDYLPKVIGALLIVAAVGYITDGAARTILTNYADHEALFGAIVIAPAVVGELAIAAWLLIKGVKTPGESNTTAPVSAPAGGVRI